MKWPSGVRAEPILFKEHTMSSFDFCGEPTPVPKPEWPFPTYDQQEKHNLADQWDRIQGAAASEGMLGMARRDPVGAMVQANCIQGAAAMAGLTNAIPSTMRQQLRGQMEFHRNQLNEAEELYARLDKLGLLDKTKQEIRLLLGL